MLRTNQWSHCVSRVELDQRSREASFRLEQVERLLKPPGDCGILGSCGLFIFSASAHAAPRRNDTITEGPQLEGRPALSA